MIEIARSVLVFCARHARWVLVCGLLGGLVFQHLAVAARPYIPVFIALLLFTAALRIGFENAVGAAQEFRKHLSITLQMQVFFPLILVLIVTLLGVNNIFVTALVLVAAAAPISGSPNLVIMLGHAPAPALRQLVIGTALLPLTVLPVFLFMPMFGSTLTISITAGKLLLVISGAAAAGFIVRQGFFPSLDDRAIETVDGLSTLLMALVVVGLMSALGDAWRYQPLDLLFMLAFVFVLNFGFQFLGSRYWCRVVGSEYHVPLSVISGNRNVALYLTALPAAVVDDLFLFIGCYQFPMYLTPLLLRRFYSRVCATNSA